MNSNAPNAMIARIKWPSGPPNAVIAKGRNRGETPNAIIAKERQPRLLKFKEVRGFSRLFPPLVNQVENKGTQGSERGTTRNFLQSFPLSSAPVVQSYWAWILSLRLQGCARG